MRHLVLAIVGAVALLFAGQSSWAEDESDAVALAKALPEATVSLEQALKAGEREGRPISAKFEIENGTLQLSVYAMNRDQYSEVIVDHRSGAIKSAQAIVAGDDLKAAGAQGSAMSKARISLQAAVANALKAWPGYRAVGVEPALENGHPVATTTLMKGQDVKKVSETLD
jgi:tryptophan synthase beta subunit